MGSVSYHRRFSLSIRLISDQSLSLSGRWITHLFNFKRKQDTDSVFSVFSIDGRSHSWCHLHLLPRLLHTPWENKNHQSVRPASFYNFPILWCRCQWTYLQPSASSHSHCALYFLHQCFPRRSSSELPGLPHPDSSKPHTQIMTVWIQLTQTGHFWHRCFFRRTLRERRTPWTWTAGTLVNQEAARFRVTSSSKLIGWRISTSCWEVSVFRMVLKNI